jgi:hypothetical protein
VNRSHGLVRLCVADAGIGRAHTYPGQPLANEAVPSLDMTHPHTSTASEGIVEFPTSDPEIGDTRDVQEQHPSQPGGRMHAVTDGSHQTACGRLVDDLHEWPDLPFPQPAGLGQSYCSACLDVYP